MKIKELRKLITGFGCRLPRTTKVIVKKTLMLNALTVLMMMSFTSNDPAIFFGEKSLLDEALGYIYYYNNVPEHSSLNYQTPFQSLKQSLPDIDENIGYTIPGLLNNAAVKIGP